MNCFNQKLRIMKMTALLATAVLLASAACEKIDSEPARLPALEGEDCSLVVHFADNAATKVVGETSSGESMIQNVQIFVFRSDGGGILDACVSAGFDRALGYDSLNDSGFSLNLTCTTGEREIWAVVNAAADFTSDASVGSRDELLAKTTALSENAPDRLFMIGSVEKTLSAGSSTVEIAVKRVCASVVLESVTNLMEAEVYRNPGSFRIKDVYLLNVPARTDYGLNTASTALSETDWYARLGKETDAAKSELILDTSSPKVLDYGESDDTRHSFYSYPNSCMPSTEDSWCPRATLLVLEAEFDVDGNTYGCYYPVTLFDEAEGSGLESNRQYRVSLTIRRPGSDNPNRPVEFDTLSGVIEIVDWESGTEYSETI